MWIVFPYFPLAFHYVWRVLVGIPVFGPPPFLLLVCAPCVGVDAVFTFFRVLTFDISAGLDGCQNVITLARAVGSEAGVMTSQTIFVSSR